MKLFNSNIDNSYRFERKFWIEGLTKQELEMYVKINQAAFSEIFYERQVNNIYLDTANLKSYLQNINGDTERAKIRIRWYGNLEGRVKNPVLEFKIKTGLMGEKLSFPLTNFTFNTSLTSNKLRDIFLKSKLSSNILEKLLEAEPKLVNCYLRKYFMSADKKYRATIDSNLRFRNIENNNNLFNSEFRVFTPIILEMKYQNGDDNFANKISQEFPFRMTKSSKYVMGINMVKGLGY